MHLVTVETLVCSGTVWAYNTVNVHDKFCVLQAQLIAQSIGQAFQVAYMEFLKANGIEDPSLMKEIDYQEVLNQQEIYGEELNLFSNKDLHKEVVIALWFICLLHCCHHFMMYLSLTSSPSFCDVTYRTTYDVCVPKIIGSDIDQ